MHSCIIRVTRRLRKMIDGRLGVTLPVGSVKMSPASGLSLEAPCKISGGVDLTFPVEIGAFSYFDAQERKPRMLTRGAHVGRYCSIAIDVQLSLIPHPTDWLSTSPVIYASSFHPWKKHCDGEIQALTEDFKDGSAPSVVGNDVWIGTGVKVMRGVRIGDGAIVAAGAVVTKDVPPYAVVAGVPARVVKYRFCEDVIRRLKAVEWWKYDLASLGPVDFSDVNKALDAIETAVRDGRAKPYVRRKIGFADLFPYSNRCLFHFSCRDGWLCVKVLGIWLLHFRMFRGVGTRGLE